MSQYPYLPPQPDYRSTQQYYAQASGMVNNHARRASVLMFIVGPLFCLCAVGLGVFSQMDFHKVNLPAETVAQFESFDAQAHQIGWTFAGFYSVVAVLTFIPGVAALILAGYVWRGTSATPMILSMVLAVIVGLFLLLGLVGTAAQGSAQLLLYALLLGVDITLIVWLIRAMGMVRVMRDARIAMQYGQQPQAFGAQYGHPGYAPQHPHYGAPAPQPGYTYPPPAAGMGYGSAPAAPGFPPLPPGDAPIRPPAQAPTPPPPPTDSGDRSI